MQRRFLVLMLFAMFCLPCVASGQEDNRPPEGFRALFNGLDLTGWHGMKTIDPKALAAMSAQERQASKAANATDVAEHWTVESGQIVNDGHGVYLTTDEDFENVEFWIDYRTVPNADSGIYLRATPQIQIWDWTEAGGKWNLGADRGSGGLWNNAAGSLGKDPKVRADKAFGEWNRFRIRQIGALTSVWLNGWKVVDNAPMHNYWDRNRPLFPYGPIQLQTHGGEIRWRNVFLREIPWDEALVVLRRRNREGFKPIFNGQNLEGWQGATDNYHVAEGVLSCKAGKGGTIFTDDQYGDFAVCFEFKLPPGGNNGLAIRYSGEGDPAYQGMCELQILDSEHPKYKDLDVRQYHGSAYGMAPAARGYLRPAGEWNIQFVRVVGSRVTVELNGYQILDTDLAEITEYLGNTPHPGKDRAVGYFGFAGHSDPVEFRNVWLRPF